MQTKTEKLLHFLRDVAKLRRKRVWAYSENDRIFWLNDLPSTEKECTSPFHNSDARDAPCWLTVRKPRIPTRPDPPAISVDWIAGGAERLDNYGTEPPELRSEIAVVPQPIADSEDDTPLANGSQRDPQTQVLLLSDNPEIERLWLEYAVDEWLPWATEMRRLESIRAAYESLDTMRRRLEEAAEFYELVLAVGLLQWRDSTGKAVSRHLITASAEIDFVAERGTISVVPSASFNACRLELDMLEPQDQPRLDNDEFQERLGELGIELWNGDAVAKVLSEIANRKGAASTVYSETLDPRSETTTDFCVSFAPAIVLRQRRLIAYDDLLKDFIEQARDNPPTTTPWRILLGDPSDDADPDHDSPAPDSGTDDCRRYLPLATNEEQEKIIDRLERSSAVVVKGPPGTGKSHTIANLMCHLLAKGERILVTAHAPKALSVLLEKLPAEIAALCVSALASSKDDMELLKKSVAGIIQRWNNKLDPIVASKAIDELERERFSAQAALQKTLRAMREAREAESYQHELPGGYVGTASAIAQQLEQTAELSWLAGAPELHHAFPLSTHELSELAEINSQLTPERLTELLCDLGTDTLPAPEEFERAVSEYRVALSDLKSLSQIESGDGRGLFDSSRLTEAQTDRIIEEIKQLERCIALGNRILGSACEGIVADLLSGRFSRYREILSNADATLDGLRRSNARVGEATVEAGAQSTTSGLKSDTCRRLAHFSSGGRRGLLFLKPAVVRETAYIEKTCGVNGRPPRSLEALDQLDGFLEVQLGVAQLRELWPHTSITGATTSQLLSEYEEAFDALRRLVDVCEQGLSEITNVLQLDAKVQLVDSRTRLSFANSLALAKCRDIVNCCG